MLRCDHLPLFRKAAADADPQYPPKRGGGVPADFRGMIFSGICKDSVENQTVQKRKSKSFRPPFSKGGGSEGGNAPFSLVATSEILFFAARRKSKEKRRSADRPAMFCRPDF